MVSLSMENHPCGRRVVELYSLLALVSWSSESQKTVKWQLWNTYIHVKCYFYLVYSSFVITARNVECCHKAELYQIFMLWSDYGYKDQLYASGHKESQRHATSFFFVRMRWSFFFFVGSVCFTIDVVNALSMPLRASMSFQRMFVSWHQLLI